MELSINISNLFPRYDFGKCIDIYKEAGFTACDYSLTGLVNDGDRWNGDNYRELAEEVRRISDEKGFPITQTHAPFTFKAAQWDDPVIFEPLFSLHSTHCSFRTGAENTVHCDSRNKAVCFRGTVQ